MATNTEEPNVVTETQLKEKLQQGFMVEVVATKNAEKVKAFWYGNWFVRLVSPDRSYERILLL